MTPLGIVAIAGGIVSTLGLIRRPQRRRRTYAQWSLSVGSWLLLWFATASPFAARGMSNLPDHMMSHVIVMFLVPMGLIGGSTARSLVWVVPVSLRRSVMRRYYLRHWRTPAWLCHPMVAAVVMNGVMVCAHVPSIFNFVMARRWAMDWLMEPAFLASGLFFFHFIIPAWPKRPKARLRWQLVMIAVTMFEMLVMAMAMSIFTKAAWYTMAPTSAMDAMPGMGPSPAVAFQQQQLSAAILWVCGDFWAVPCLVLIVRRVMARDGSLLAALERQSSRFSTSP